MVFEQGWTRGLRREGGNLFEPVIVNGHNTFHYRHLCTIEEFVWMICGPANIMPSVWITATSNSHVVKTCAMFVEKMTDQVSQFVLFVFYLFVCF
jgi:hypothetical protein